MMKYKMFGAAAFSIALAMTPALARDGHGAGGRGGAGGMSHGASLGASRNATVAGGSFQNRAAGSSFRGANRVAGGGQFTRGNQFARGGNFRGHRRGGFGVGVGAGVALGYYGADYYGYGDGAYDDAYGDVYGDAYYGGDDAAPPAYAYQDGAAVDADSCFQRYHSYDPSTGTYLGYDGRRHPCL
jgi:hypothetical protein